LTYFVRHTARAASDDTTPWWGGTSTCRVPTEVALYDLMLPAGWSDPSTATVAVYGHLQDVQRAARRDRADRLPVSAALVHLGQDLDRFQTPLVPRCPEMIREMVRRMGWGDTRFDLFRCVIRYPVLHAGVATRVDAAHPSLHDRSRTAPPSSPGGDGQGG